MLVEYEDYKTALVDFIKHLKAKNNPEDLDIIEYLEQELKLLCKS